MKRLGLAIAAVLLLGVWASGATVTYYVDVYAGNDSNSGLIPADPLKTVLAACGKAVGGNLTVVNVTALDSNDAARTCQVIDYATCGSGRTITVQPTDANLWAYLKWGNSTYKYAFYTNSRQRTTTTMRRLDWLASGDGNDVGFWNRYTEGNSVVVVDDCSILSARAGCSFLTGSSTQEANLIIRNSRVQCEGVFVGDSVIGTLDVYGSVITVGPYADASVLSMGANGGQVLRIRKSLLTSEDPNGSYARQFIELSQTCLREVTIEDCEWNIANCGSVGFFMLPEANARTLNLSIKRNRFVFPRLASTTSSLFAIGQGGYFCDVDDANWTRTEVATTKKLRDWWGRFEIADNTIVAQSPQYWTIFIGLGPNGARILRNRINGTQSGATLRVWESNCLIANNEIIGNAACDIAGDNCTIVGNYLMGLGSLGGLLLWEPTGCRSLGPPQGGRVIGNVIGGQRNKAFEDGSDIGSGVWEISTKVDNNIYWRSKLYKSGSSAAVTMLRNVQCHTISQLQAQWAAMADANVHANDTNSRIVLECQFPVGAPALMRPWGAAAVERALMPFLPGGGGRIGP